MGERKITIIAYDCPGCGASLNIESDQKSVTCEYCGMHFTIEEEKEAEPKTEHVYATVENIPKVTMDPKKMRIMVITIVLLVGLVFVPFIFGIIFSAFSLVRDIGTEVKVATKVTEADPFKNVQVRLEGMEPIAEVSEVINGTDIRGIRYHVDKKTDLSNGDVITIEAEDMSGYKWTNTSYQYTISGLSQLVTDLSQLTQEDQDLIYSEAKREIEKNWEMNLSSTDRTAETLHLTLQPYKMYLGVRKDANIFTDKNAVYPAFETTIEENGKTYTFYQYARIENIYHSSGGAFHGEFNTMDGSFGYIYTGEYGFGDNFAIWGYESVLKMESAMVDENYILTK